MKHLYLNTNCLLPVSNVTASCYSFIGAGCCNVISNGCSSIVGGFCNTVSGGYSSILGGQGNKVTHNWASASGYNITSAADCTFHVNCLNACSTPLYTGGGPFPPGTIFMCAAPYAYPIHPLYIAL